MNEEEKKEEKEKEETPPTLGVNVSDEVTTKDKPA